jgi:hypothetical protein
VLELEGAVALLEGATALLEGIGALLELLGLGPGPPSEELLGLGLGPPSELLWLSDELLSPAEELLCAEDELGTGLSDELLSPAEEELLPAVSEGLYLSLLGSMGLSRPRSAQERMKASSRHAASKVKFSLFIITSPQKNKKTVMPPASSAEPTM